VVLNPPYGQRLGTGQESRRLFKAICRKLGRDFKGWRTILIAPTRTLARQTGLHLTPHAIRHGGKARVLLTGVI
jgi:putative N6-adenine-specific DNA methylase